MVSLMTCGIILKEIPIYSLSCLNHILVKKKIEKPLFSIFFTFLAHLKFKFFTLMYISVHELYIPKLMIQKSQFPIIPLLLVNDLFALKVFSNPFF